MIKSGRDQLIAALENASYPIREVEVSERSEDVTEFAATLVSTSIESGELDAVATALKASPRVSHASWSSTADDCRRFLAHSTRWVNFPGRQPRYCEFPLQVLL
ncbi:hypothetical protein QM467_17245 [Rhodoblastus sp. 17X3]|uniref:hypothetical protein n=1 Tax=Rhodoblastus sp. 17X3 TaxID=3047026 RepID=UPI0024B68CCE|nr:hypothetical protein [Rhodoblastus sp. 17X3]MDI9849794.1 hypothetical protein [Rhodoblastus sp. 17X3]